MFLHFPCVERICQANNTYSKSALQTEAEVKMCAKDRSRHQRCSVKNGVLKVSQISQQNACVGVSFYLRACNCIKKRFQQRCFPVYFAKFLRTPSLKNICERLLLYTIATLKNFAKFTRNHLASTLQ